jgi:hypothetical protein
MHQGHVDRITRQFVSGWAVDTSTPDEEVEITIFMDGRKLAQIACNEPRADLRSMGPFGDGRHGFRYEFKPPLPDVNPISIAVRFAESGTLLGKGTAVLARGATEAVATMPPPEKQEQLIVSAPVDPGTLFRLFTLYEPAMELYTLLCRLDFSRVRPNHLYYSVFGEIPTPHPRGMAWSPAIARDYLNDLLNSSRFQQRVLIYALRAFPEKRRLLFVHIPKCAGSDLSFHIGSRFPSLEQRLMDEALRSKADLFEALAGFVRELTFANEIFVRGHVPLDFYAAADLIRPADRVFTILRDPSEIALSQINYILTKFQLNIDAGLVERDTAAWMRVLGLTELPPKITPEFVQKYAHELLYNTYITEPNSMCHWLGGGDAEVVIARLARHLVQVTNTEHYNPWLLEEWGISARTRQNESMKFVSLATLTHQELGYVQALSPEDRKLYSQVQIALDVTGKTSVSGEEIVNAAL